MVGTSIMSIYRDYLMGHVNIATFWCVLNAFFLGAFVVTAFLENRQKKRNSKRGGDPSRPKHGMEPELASSRRTSALADKQTTEPLTAEAILGAQAAKDSLAALPELYDRKG